jgi:AcrR family transcriptional regulator
MGTLYRHFPTKEDLVDAVLEETFDQIVGAAEQALTDDDAWRGLRGFFEDFFALHVKNRGLKDMLATQAHGRERADAMRARMRPLIRLLVKRAQEQGALRADFAPEDMPFVIWSVGRVIEETRVVAPELWRRHLGFLLDGLRTEAATPLPQPPLTRAQLDRVTERRHK